MICYQTSARRKHIKVTCLSSSHNPVKNNQLGCNLDCIYNLHLIKMTDSVSITVQILALKGQLIQDMMHFY